MNQFEIGILDWIQSNLRTEFLDAVLSRITALGNDGIIWILLTVVLLCTKKYRRVGVLCGVSLLLDLFFCNILIKPLVARVRPFHFNPMAPELLIPQPGEFSFPSGHTAGSFAAVSALYAGKTRLWIPAAVLAAVIAFSRLYLYVHYPTDVLGGLALGWSLGFLARWIVGHVEKGVKKNR